MQVSAHVGLDLIGVMQALIIMFVAAPDLTRSIWRLKAPEPNAETGTPSSSSWDACPPTSI